MLVLATLERSCCSRKEFKRVDEICRHNQHYQYTQFTYLGESVGERLGASEGLAEVGLELMD
jgi:hypothetical protein|eukprot:scaffold779_cov205-Alexandrium_tamarense.AAC.38